MYCLAEDENCFWAMIIQETWTVEFSTIVCVEMGKKAWDEYQSEPSLMCLFFDVNDAQKRRLLPFAEQIPKRDPLHPEIIFLRIAENENLLGL